MQSSSRLDAPTVVTLLVWGVLCSAVLVFIAHLGSDVPFVDEYDVLPQLVGAEPITLAWLWAPHNEHRIPLPKLLQVGLTHLAGCDFRAALYFDAVLMGLTALLLLAALRQARGRTVFTDAFVPLALLHLGYYETWLWGFVVALVAGTFLMGSVLALLVCIRGTPDPRTGLLLGVCLLLLPLCGAHGLLLAPPLALWLLAAAGAALRSPEAGTRRGGVLLLGLLLLLAGLGGLHLLGNEPLAARRDAAAPEPAAAVRVAAQFLAVGFGPCTGYRWALWTLGATLLYLATAAALLLVAWARPAERWRATGLLLFLAGGVLLALGIGWGRAGRDPYAGLSLRYIPLSAPLLCAVYCTWSLYGGRGMRVALCTLLLACALVNTREGLAGGPQWRQRLQAVEDLARAGLPPAALARTPEGRALFPGGQERLAEGLELLHRTRLGPYRDRPAE